MRSQPCLGVEWAYRQGDWKLSVGVVSDQVYPVPLDVAAVEVAGLHHDASGNVWWDTAHYQQPDASGSTAGPNMWLFNVSADPTESNNLINAYPRVVAELRAKVHAIVHGDDYLAPCNIPNGSCVDDDPTAQAVVDAHGGWYPWL